ncbi:LuxR family transcriptional regulator [Streptomyces sp. NPDC023723]|uniref:LuxR family transcriptional regulator n=1 Tax=Streptomyces sp. NPDC023723 TaxID=3154323 RepID=UPI0033DCF8FE
MDLVERERSRSALEELFAQAYTGGGRAALAVGAPGMGKSALIRQVQTHAAGAGAVVLSAVASRAEKSLPMGVIGQLLGAVGSSSSRSPDLDGLLSSAITLHPEEWTMPSHTSVTAPIVEGVHRVVRGLTERAPLLITVDDIHESDAASLFCLLYLVRRAAMSRMLVVLSDGHVLPQMSSPLTSEFFGNPACSLIHLTPFSAQRTRVEIAPHTPPGTVDRRAASCHRASGGNPLLLRALLEDDDRVDDGRVDDGSAERPGRGVTPVAGANFRLAVRYLLNRLEKPMPQVARGLALLATEATPGRLDRLLALPSGTAAQTLSTLDAVGLTWGGRLQFEATRAAVLEEMSTADRVDLRRRAAWLLYEEGAPAPAVASLLVAAGTSAAESWALPVLSDAAEHALRGGDVRGAVACLHAARTACRTGEQRAAVRAELARTEWDADPSLVLGHLTGLIHDHGTDRLEPRHGLLLAGFLLWHGRPETAADVLADLSAAGDRLSDSQRSHLPSVRAWLRYAYPAAGARIEDGHEPADPPPLDETIAGTRPDAVSAGPPDARSASDPATGAVAVAESLLQSTVMHGPRTASALAGLTVLFDHARLDRAAAWCEVLIDKLPNQPRTARALFLAASAAVECRRENFELAGERAGTALSLLTPAAWGVTIGIPLAVQALSRLAAGDRRGADACFAVPVPPEMFGSLPGLHYLQARGRRHLTEGRHHAALGDFYACREVMTAANLADLRSVPWRLYAAEALAGLGDLAGARALLTTEWEYGADGRRAPAERRRAQRLMDCLETAVSEAARHPLQPVVLYPGGLGDGAAERASFDVLSPAEQRVARLAVRGHTNREIAARLFVTMSTVEQHLTRSYQKLGVRGRPDLLSRLGAQLTVH